MKGIATFSVKILSLYFLIVFITEGSFQIFGIINSGQSMRTGIIAGIIITQVLKLLIALYLWFSAEKLSNFIISDEKVEPIKTINYRKLHLIAFSVVGVILLAISVPVLVQYILEYFSIPGRVSTNMLPKMAAKITQIIIGFWLLVKPTSIVNKIKRNN